MAANQSIKELMTAENKASAIIREARQERGERLKQAKLDADAEISLFRKQQEHMFQMNGNNDLMSDDPIQLEHETDEATRAMQAAFQRNKDKVINMMVEYTTKVQLVVPAARKGI